MQPRRVRTLATRDAVADDDGRVVFWMLAFVSMKGQAPAIEQDIGAIDL